MNNKYKIIIIYSEKSFDEIVPILTYLNKYYKITPIIINTYKDGTKIPLNEIEIFYKNDSLVFYKELNSKYNKFATKEDLDGNDLLFLTYEEFNNVSDGVLSEYDFFICVIDSKKHSKNDIDEGKYTFERIKAYYYYLNDN